LRQTVSRKMRLHQERSTVPAKKKKATAKKKDTAKAEKKKKKATAKKAAPRASSSALSQHMPAEPGDRIVIDSSHVGSPAREGEVLEVIHGEVSVSYWVQWTDGHQTLIGPTSGAARIVRASEGT
jgi:hypothetical protein